MAEAPRFTFRPLTRDDLALLASWLRRPHVAAWWGAPGSDDDVRREYEPELASDVAWLRLACLDGDPVGFAQIYDVMRCDPEWWRDETDPGARGIDLFLADEALLGRGLGTTMIAALVEHVFSTDPRATKVQADPSPDNARAIRAFEKAGLRRLGEVTTPDGRALLMVVERGSR
jgi:RimJ/RimL family protein N-acetyltransferase